MEPWSKLLLAKAELWHPSCRDGKELIQVAKNPLLMRNPLGDNPPSAVSPPSAVKLRPAASLCCASEQPCFDTVPDSITSAELLAFPMAPAIRQCRGGLAGLYRQPLAWH